MSYFKLELLNLAESPIDILSSAADSQRVYYLANTISEFYSPEFSVKSEGDVYEALEKSRRIIEEWN